MRCAHVYTRVDSRNFLVLKVNGMKKLPRTLLLGSVIFLLLILIAVVSWRALLNSRSSALVEVEKLSAGNEISALKQAEAEPPNDGEIVAVPCKSQTQLRAGEFLVGRPGAFLKVLPSGEMKQTSGEELADVREAFDPVVGDAMIPIQVECAEDVEEADGEITWYVSTLKTDQFFSTKKGTRFETKISDKDQLYFQTSINQACVIQSEAEEGVKEGKGAPAKPAACVRPQVIAITDLNGNGNREFWFNEPYKWDLGVGVIEEPNQRVLKACPGCAE